ncbi:MAG: hypothetical protein RLP44_21685 [Aggregatilineales bacterium]
MTTTRTITHKYASSVTWSCIGHPDDPHKTLVDERGALLYDYVNSIPAEGTYWFNKVFSFGLVSPQPPLKITQITESAIHPFVKTTIEYAHATLELLAFGHEQNNKRTDIVLWNVACADSQVAVDTAVWVDAHALGKAFVLPQGDTAPEDVYKDISSQQVYMLDAQHWAHIDSYFLVKPTLEKYSDASENGQTCAYISVPYALNLAPGQHFGPVSRMKTPIFTAQAGKPIEGAFIFPVNHEGDAGYDLEWAKQALETERAFWASYPIQPFAMHIPDNDVMDMVTACARNILQAREIKDSLPEFQVGPTSYRGLWVVDGHFILEAARYLGYEDAGEQGINALLRRVQPSGEIRQLDFHPKETGISILTLIRQCELNDDWDRLASVWSVIQNGVTFIRHLREESKKRGEDAAEYNLMPATFADGGLGGERPEYTTALWTLVGLQKAVEAAKKLGYSDDEKRFQHEYDDLLAVFHEKAKRDMRTLDDGTPYLPISMPDASSEHVQIPDFEGEVSAYYRINPGTATWALAHAIYPGEVFAPDDPIVQNLCTLLDKIDDEEGIPANTGWIPHNAVWNYSASFYAHVWLYVGRPDKAIDYLYDFANHASPTRVWREEQSLRSATYEQLVGDMPHNWGSAEFIRLVRNLLVFERGNTLDLLLGLPPEWIKAGETIQLVTTPTRFGAVSLDLSFDESVNAVLKLTVETQRTQQPEAVTVYLPDGYAQIQLDRHEITPVSGKTVTIPFQNQVIRLMR